MAIFQLATHPKTAAKAKDVRIDGYIPAVIYGPGVREHSSMPVSIEYQAFRKVYRAAGESTVIELDVGGETIPVLVHSLQFHPVSGDFEHIDFYAMDMNKEVHTHIPLIFIGTAPAVKEKNAVLITAKESLEVKCLPRHLVHDLTVDISGLAEYHEQISVKDINVPENITVLDNPADMVVSAAPPKLEVEEAPVEKVPEAGEAGKEGEAATKDGNQAKKEDSEKTERR